MKEYNVVKSVAAIIVVALFLWTMVGTDVLIGQEVISKNKVIEFAQKFLQQNQSNMQNLEGASFNEPELIEDENFNPIKWRVEIIKEGQKVGYFYARADMAEDGTVPVWFEGLGTVKENVDETAHRRQAQKERERKYFQKEGTANFPKGQSTPAMGYSSLVFDPSLYHKVTPKNDDKEMIEQEQPQAPGATVTIKSEGFEGSFPNTWSVYAKSGYTDAYWDDTGYKKHVGSWGGFCADEGTAGTGYGGQYVNNMNAWMVYGPFSLSDASDAWVDFDHWTKTESSFDKFHYVASTNGINFYGYYFTGNMTDDAGNDSGWLDQNFDLTNVYTIGDLTGQSQVWIAFVFTSDGSIINDGTYLDEIYLKKVTGGDPEPTLVDHFTCKDGFDPYNTRTTAFLTTDAIATEFVKFNSSASTTARTVRIDFYDVSDALYWGAQTSVPAGNSNWTWWAGIYIAGNTPATQPGTWNARVKLNGVQKARDNFTIGGGGTPDIRILPTSVEIHQSTGNTATFQIQNTGGANLIISSMSDNKSWLSYSPNYTNHTIPAGESRTITATVTNWSGVTSPSETGRITVNSNDPDEATRQVDVTAYPIGDPDIAVNPTSLDIYETPANSPTPPDGSNAEDVDVDPFDPANHGRGLIIPDDVKTHWQTQTPNLNYNYDNLAASVDWSANDSPVKNQYACGSCWAFAALGLVENLGGFNDLSEQVLVSCVSGNDCSGGWYHDAFDYIRTTGVPPEACYPYTVTNGNCSNKCSDPDYLVKLTSNPPYPGLWGEPATVNNMKAALNTGPIAVALIVPTDGTFDSYSGGVYNYSGGAIPWANNGHAVLLVGYNDTGSYFKAKNSWGTGWGESGYFRIAYDDVTDDMHFGCYASDISGVYQEGGTGEAFTISNTGGANLIVSSMTVDKTWLTMSPTTIPTLVPSASQVVTVSVNNWSAVATPEETATIGIQSNDPDEAQRQVSVTAHRGNVTNPVLHVTPLALSFSVASPGQNPPSQSISISNTGSGSFSWTVADAQSWLAENPTSGSTSTETDVVTVSVNTAGMSSGTHNGTITVTAAGAQGSPKQVSVTLNIGGGPCTPPYIKAEDVTGGAGSDVVVDVKILQNPTAIDAFGFQFTYNSGKCSLVNVQKGDLTNGFSFFQASEGPAGTITIGGFNTAAIPANSNGTIARVNLHVNQCSEGETFVLGIQSLTDDLVGLNMCNGTFTCQACALGDVNMDDAISPGDALCAFQIYLNGGTPPPGECSNECSVYAADVNCSPNGVTPGDALYIFQSYLSGEVPPLDCDPTFATSAAVNANNIQLSLVDYGSSIENEITVAIQVSNPHGLNAFGMDIGFPDNVLAFVHSNATILTECWQAMEGNENVAGVVSIGGFNDEAIAADNAGYLATVTFKVLDQTAADVDLWLSNLVDDLSEAKLTAEAFKIPLVTTAVRKIGQDGIPKDFSLDQNYPNPFNMETEIVYQLPKSVHVKLEIYNSMGQKVRTLISENQDAGRYAAHWNGKDVSNNELPTGVYIYKLTTSDFVSAKKLILIK